jgi:putative heme iron utilization protein
LIATLMIEIDEPARRTAMLMKLAGIEESVSLTIGSVRIAATPTDYEDRTTPEGKTSSVHWVRFRFTQDEIAAFKNSSETVVLAIAHENYGHMAVVPADTRSELAKDFD